MRGLGKSPYRVEKESGGTSGGVVSDTRKNYFDTESHNKKATLSSHSSFTSRHGDSFRRQESFRQCGQTMSSLRTPPVHPSVPPISPRITPAPPSATLSSVLPPPPADELCMNGNQQLPLWRSTGASDGASWEQGWEAGNGGGGNLNFSFRGSWGGMHMKVRGITSPRVHPDRPGVTPDRSLMSPAVHMNSRSGGMRRTQPERTSGRSLNPEARQFETACDEGVGGGGAGSAAGSFSQAWAAGLMAGMSPLDDVRPPAGNGAAIGIGGSASSGRGPSSCQTCTHEHRSQFGPEPAVSNLLPDDYPLETKRRPCVTRCFTMPSRTRACGEMSGGSTAEPRSILLGTLSGSNNNTSSNSAGQLSSSHQNSTLLRGRSFNEDHGRTPQPEVHNGMIEDNQELGTPGFGRGGFPNERRGGMGSFGRVLSFNDQSAEGPGSPISSRTVRQLSPPFASLPGFHRTDGPISNSYDVESQPSDNDSESSPQSSGDDADVHSDKADGYGNEWRHRGKLTGRRTTRRQRRFSGRTSVTAVGQGMDDRDQSSWESTRTRSDVGGGHGAETADTALRRAAMEGGAEPMRMGQLTRQPTINRARRDTSWCLGIQSDTPQTALLWKLIVWTMAVVLFLSIVGYIFHLRDKTTQLELQLKHFKEVIKGKKGRFSPPSKNPDKAGLSLLEGGAAGGKEIEDSDIPFIDLGIGNGKVAGEPVKVVETFSCLIEGGGENELSLADSNLRQIALFVSILAIITPFIIYKYIDTVPMMVPFVCKQGGGNDDDTVPLSKKIAYRVDVLFSTHSFVKPLTLLLATIFLIALGGVALYAVGTDGLASALWQAWTFVADAGNHADSIGVGPRIVAIMISFGGMLIFALMLGLVSEAISEKVDSLKKGRSDVIESNHTLILGWSDKLGSLLNQLAIANESMGGGVVVILAERDKEQMEGDIAKMEFDLKGTSVICRSGSPLIMADLKKVSVSTARAIIVLAEVQNADESDAKALRVLLSLKGVKESLPGSKESLSGHVVVELSGVDNEQVVKLVGGDMVETVVAHDVIGRLMIQCARQPGLAQIWESILGFENSEFYLKEWPELEGCRFEDVLISFPDAIPCGVRSASEERIYLNPKDSYRVQAGDQILVIAEDDDSYEPVKNRPEVRKTDYPSRREKLNRPEKILFCGWRRDIDDMIRVTDDFVEKGSEVWMFSEVPVGERDEKLREAGLNPTDLRNIQLMHREGNTVIRRHLESLPLEEFTSILILADEKYEDAVVNADSRSLATLLLIRDVQRSRMPLDPDEEPLFQRQSSNCSQNQAWIRVQEASRQSIIISEILDARTKNLVTVSKISDYVLSNELISMALAMVAEDRQINKVLAELFDSEGNELYTRLAGHYLYKDGEELSFYEVMLRARQRQEIVIGYRLHQEEKDRLQQEEKAVINPPDKHIPRAWRCRDVFVILSNNSL